MLQSLQKKWKVNGLQLVLILCTFAIGGSLTGFAGKKLMNLFFIDQRWLWLVVYIIVVTVIWPFAVLLVSIPFGQYRFFTKYLQKMGRRMGLVKKMTDSEEQIVFRIQHPVSSIAIFASGAGSNAQKIIDHFRDSAHTQIA